VLTTEDVLQRCESWMRTVPQSAAAGFYRAQKRLQDKELPTLLRLDAVLEFAQQHRRPPRALLLWIGEAIDREIAAGATRDPRR